MPENKSDATKSEIYQRAKAFDEFLAQNAEVVVQNTIASTRVNYDGATEKGNQQNIATIKNRIAACREAYENMGIIGNAIDLMVDFALEGFIITHTNPAIEKFYKNWAKKVKLRYIVECALKGIYRDGNVPIYYFRNRLSEEDIKIFKRIIAKNDKNNNELSIENEFETTEDYKKTIAQETDVIIPTKYKILDIMNLYPTGNEIFGTLKYEYMINSKESKAIFNSDNPIDKEIVNKLKKDFGDEAVKMMEPGRIVLDINRLRMLHYKKDDYKYWATPMLWRVMDDVKFKKLLRDMDISVAESVCNTVTIFALGKAEEGLLPDKEKFSKLVSLLKIPSRSKQFVWDNLIDVKSEYPPVETILGKEKYEQVDGDIRGGLGIAEVILNGQGGNYANSFLSVKTLLERLETGRDHVMEWLEEQIAIVAKAMKFRKPAFIKLRHMSLTNKDVEDKMILELLDRNMLSYKTVMEYFGENFEIEVNRMKEEDKLRLQVQNKTPFVLLKTGKFGPQHQKGAIPLFTVDEEAPEQSPTGQEGEGDKGGRPKGTRKKQTKKRNTKPQGISTSNIMINDKFLFEGIRKFNDIYSIFDENIEIDKLSDCAIDALYDNIILIMSQVEKTEMLTESKITEICKLDVDQATAPAKLERCVKSVKDKKVQQFKKKNNRSPNKKEMKEIVSSSWAICRSSLGV